ncbi:MAG: AI-2E family transporter [Lachnospiraceae bacterium]|nr:AI-2E family transporter [Lachnospiraceae bacterium]
MQRNRFREYFMRSLTGFGTLALAILFFFFFYNLKSIVSALGSFIDILMPVIYGLVISFLLAPMSEWIEHFLNDRLPAMEKAETRATLIRVAGVAGAILITVVLLVLMLVLILPQLFQSIMNLANSIPAISRRLIAWVENVLANQPELQETVVSYYSDFESSALNWVQNIFLPKFQEVMTNLSSGLISFVVVLKNLLLGLIISIYVLMNRKLYKAQTKKVVYAVLPVKAANWLVYLGRDIREVFSGFLMGKLVDSLIIGLLCFVCITIMNMPYTVLISTIVGVTNIIPYFGPFFGAIPSALLVLTVSPLKALYFLIFILILQQVDGNIIGPKILGSSTGLSSFWVLISLLIFGGLFGVVGMVIGVPVAAIMYDLVSEFMRWLLKNKNLPQSSASYAEADYVDIETGQVVEKSAESGATALGNHEPPAPSPTFENMIRSGISRGRKKTQDGKSEKRTNRQQTKL